MTAPAYLVFDGDPTGTPPVYPRRPSVADMGGAAYEDDATYAPEPDVMPMAEDANQVVKVVEGLTRTGAAVWMSVAFSTGTPTIHGMACLGTLLQASDFTLTDNADGDTSITWTATKLPVSNVWPAGLTLHAIPGFPIQQFAAVPITNGVQVLTRDTDGNGIDCPFTVMLAGTVAPP